jgi:hypothetical protein
MGAVQDQGGQGGDIVIERSARGWGRCARRVDPHRSPPACYHDEQVFGPSARECLGPGRTSREGST